MTRRLPALSLAALIALTALVGLMVSTPSEGRGAPPVRSFYLEAIARVESAVPLSLVGATPGPPIVTVTGIRWWYRAPGLWRWEIETLQPPEEAKRLIIAFDGAVLWQYDSRENSYSRRTGYDFPPGLIPSPSFGLLFGPANAADTGELLERFRSLPEETTAEVVGEDTVLGRRTQVIEVRPSWRQAVSADSGGERRESGGVYRLWLDAERMFVLRTAIDPETPGEAALVEVTELRLNTGIAEEQFRWRPPVGARETPE